MRGCQAARGLWPLSLVAGFLLVSASSSRADDQSVKGPPEEAGKPAPSRWEIHGDVRARPEFRDNADFQRADDFDALWGQQLRLSLRVRLHSTLSGTVQIQDVHAWGAERDDVRYQFNSNARQFYLDWGPRDRFQVRLGRQELLYGNQRLLGPFGWDTVGRSFDGARLTWRWSSHWSTDALAARLVEVRRGTPRRVGNQDLYGLYTRFTPKRPEQLELYALCHQDGLRTRGELANRTPALTRIYAGGARLLRSPPMGFRYDLEHAWQLGQRGPDRHRATALAAQAGYTFDRRFSPFVAVEYDFATGDRNSADGRSGEFHNLFPTNHYFYGHADLLGWRNLHGFRTTLATQIHSKLRLQADYHRFLLASRHGRWSSASGQTLGFVPTGAVGRDIGQEVDTMARVQVNNHLQLEAGYSVFLPQTFARGTRGPELHHFGYLMTSVRF